MHIHRYGLEKKRSLPDQSGISEKRMFLAYLAVRQAQMMLPKHARGVRRAANLNATIHGIFLSSRFNVN